MNGFTAFLGKELREILRTWRIWVLPGIVLFFAISGPPLAKITPELLGSLMTDQQPGVVIQLPDPTYVDAYMQWTKNLSQMVLFAVIIMFGGIISSETKSGTAALVLTKPLSRTAFVLAKFVSQAALVAVPVIVGALATWGITYAIFAEAPLGPLAEATGVWLLFALMFVALMELLSAALDSQAGAAGIGFGAYILLSLATLWAPMLDYSPAGLVGAPSNLVMGEAASLGWPIVTTVAVMALCVGVAVLVFRRREL
ncbi:MAG: ABC transporter permease subunit [Coriobacteriia bacterium]|nr:ABC transporter permease subunit [Coriobacteriia bacterium]